MGKRKYVIFEDYRYKDLFPLTLTRAVFELKAGFYPVWKRLARYFVDNLKVEITARPCLHPVIEYKTGLKLWSPDAEGGNYVFINGRLLDFVNGFKEIEGYIDEEEVLVVSDEEVVIAVIKEDTVKKLGIDRDFFLKTEYKDILKSGVGRVVEVEATLAGFPWDLIELNGRLLEEDYADAVRTLGPLDLKGLLSKRIDRGAYILHADGSKGDVYIGSGSRVMAGSVINAENGPVYIDDNVTVMPGSVITGPCYLGPGSLIKAGATIYGETAIGEVCKIGGEVGESIVYGYSNKQHYGFLGHSYIGEWCNLGAGTCTSDLKNNYKNVRVELENGERVDTGRMFLGSIVGDYSKIGIGTLLNTGTVIGVMCNIFGGGMVSGNIPSFVWGGAGGYNEYRFDKAIETSRIVMSRRERELVPEIDDLLRYIYTETSGHRKAFLDRKGL